MENDTPPSQLPSEQPVNPDAAAAKANAPVTKASKKKWRWVRIVTGAVVVLLLLVILAPSLLSTGMGRSMALKIVNGKLNGKAEVADWSLGWSSGITVNGLKLRDEQGEVILQASRVRTQLSLFKAIKSGLNELALGRTDIDNLDLTHIHVGEDGVLNIAKVFKPSKKKSEASEPIKLSGDIHINQLTGKITSAGLPQILHVQPSNLSVKITGLNDPIENDIQLAFNVEDPSRAAKPSTAGSIALVGQVDLFEKDALHLAGATAKEKLTLTTVDVAAVNPFLALASIQLNVVGIASGAVNVNLQGADNESVTGEFTVDNFVATGAALNDEKFASRIVVPIKIRRLTGKDANILQVDDFRVVTDYGDIAITAKVARETLERISRGAAPGQKGHVTVSVNFDKAAKLIGAMPKTFDLLPEVKIDSARISATAEAWIEGDRVVTTARFDLADMTGSNKAGKIEVAPITSTADATYIPHPPAGMSRADFRDVAVSLSSAFAKMEGGTGKDGSFAQFNLNGDADLSKLQAQVKQFSSLGGLDLQGMLKISVNMTGDPSKADVPLDASAKLNITGLTVKGAGNAQAILKDQSVDVTFGGLLNFSGDEVSGDIKTLEISAPLLAEIRKKEGDLKLKVLTRSAKVTGTGGLTIFADLKRFAEISKSLSPTPVAAPALDAGAGEMTKSLLNGSISFTRGDKPQTSIAGDFVADISIKTLAASIDDKIAIALKAEAPDDLTQPLTASVDIKGNTINAGVSDAVMVLAREISDKSKVFNGPLEILTRARISMNVERIEAIQAIVNSFGASAVVEKVPATARKGGAKIELAAGEEADLVEPIPPVRNLAGKLSFNCSMGREGQASSIRDAKLDLTNLSFDRGAGHYESKDKRISVKLSARINAGSSKSQSMLGMIKSIDIVELTADLDAGQLKMTKPISISDSGGSASVAGGFEMEGKLADGLRLLEAIQAAKPGSKYPYTGYYVLAEEISTQGEKTHLVGSLKASKFRAYDLKDLKKATFSEDLITLNNDVTVNNSADPAKNTLTIGNLEINMQSTAALAVKISRGELIDWSDQRKIADKLQAHVRIDWPKFWTLVKPALDPETIKSLDDLVLAGVMERDFSVSGSFPVTGVDKRGVAINLTTPQSLKFLNAYGGLAFDRVSTGGVEMLKLDLPVSLEQGIVYIQDATKPKGQRYPQPFSCNSGTIDLGGVQIDLSHGDPADAARFDPHLTIPANKPLVSKVTFNPVLAQTTLGKYVNPGFSKSKEASGLVSVTSVECRDVPFSWFRRSADKTAGKGIAIGDGRAEFTFSIDKVRVENAVLSLLVGGQVNGDIKKGIVTIERSEVTSDIPIMINDKSVLGFAGKVNLQTGAIRTFNATVPKNLINSAAMSSLPPNVGRFIPETIVVPFKGTLDDPKFDLVQSVIASATGGKANPGDILKGIPDLLNGGKKDKK